MFIVCFRYVRTNIFCFCLAGILRSVGSLYPGALLTLVPFMKLSEQDFGNRRQSK